MPNDNAAKIKQAVGVRSVFLAAKLDTKLAGRFAHQSGQFLLDSSGSHATKRALADVMVYMAGKYGKALTLEEIEMGLLAASMEFVNAADEKIEVVTPVVTPVVTVTPDITIDEPADDAVVEMEIQSSDDDWVMDDYVSEAPAVVHRSGRPGVKPSTHMMDLMLAGDGGLTNDDAGITSYGVAIRYYDFIQNELAMPESEDKLCHKVKLAIGATMKEIGWKKRMRSGTIGWHPEKPMATDVIDAVMSEPIMDPDTVVLRKKNTIDASEHVEPVVEHVSLDSLPRLKSVIVDPSLDTTWPEMDGFTEGSEGTEPMMETMSVVIDPVPVTVPVMETSLVKVINISDGTEDIKEMEITKDRTTTYTLSDDGVPMFLEWDADEDIWTYLIEDPEE